jgi:hypothetical protein
MPYPTTGNTAPAFAELSRLSSEAKALNEQAEQVLDEIRQVLIGQHVIQWGRRWQVCQVDVRSNARVTCYGVTVSKRGKIGKRGFDLGALEHCELVEPL